MDDCFKRFFSFAMAVLMVVSYVPAEAFATEIVEVDSTVHEHTYEECVTAEATCTQAGTVSYTCSCEDSYTEEIPANGHDFVDGACTVCGEADPNYIPPTEETEAPKVEETEAPEVEETEAPEVEETEAATEATEAPVVEETEAAEVPKVETDVELNFNGTQHEEAVVNPVAMVGDVPYATLQEALNAAAAGTGNVTVEILDNINLTDTVWTPVTVSAPGYPVVTVNGNNKTITGLTDMLFAGTWAGGSGLIINNLTIKDSTIVNDKDDAKGTVGVGAFIGFPQASATITLNNCHLVNSTVEGGHWTGGLIGYAAGYAGTDGPVFMNLTITGCSVTGSTITGKGSAGGVIGHGSGNGWTNVVIKNTTVSGNTVTSTGSSTNKAGAVMGTIGAAGQPTTVNGVTHTGGAFVDATVTGNTVTSAGTTITTIYGRQGTNTGALEITGGTYDANPIEEGVTYAYPADGFAIFMGTDGSYGLKAMPTGSNSYAYTKEENGYVRVWGEGGGNASESYVLKLYSDEALIATTTLNNIGGIIDGDVYVTWNFYYPESTDEYWTTTWEEGHPNSAAQPTEVELIIDGTVVATTAAKMSGADGVAPVIWKDLGGVKNVCTGLTGDGSATNPYLISCIEELAWFRDDVNAGNTYSGKYVKLNADIDLKSEEWTPISKFRGHFDGGNHIISNLIVNGGSSSNQGFFGHTDSGSVSNLTINNAKVTGRLNVGVVAGTPYTSKYTNIKVTGHVEVNGMAYVGGVGGKNAYANWTDITVDVDSTSYVNANSVENGTAYRTYVGGVVGFNGEGGHTFKNVSSNIKVIGSTKDIGGLFGIAHYGNNFENVTFTGSVEAPEGAKEVGGIAGVWHNEAGTKVTMTEVTSTGTVTVGTVTTTGSITGGAYNASNDTAANSGSLVIDGAPVWPVVAKIGDQEFGTLQAAAEAAQDGDEIKLLKDVTLTDTVTVPAGVSVTLDLNGKTVSMVYAEDATANHEMVKNSGNLTIQDTAGNGKLSYKYTGVNLGTSYAVNTIVSDPGSTLTVKSGTIENLTYDSAIIAYAIDARTNGGAGDVTVNIEGGTITSLRQSIRIFANSTTNTGALNISAADITGRVIVQNANSSANKAALNITGGTFNANEYKTDVLYVGGSNGATIDMAPVVSGGTFNGEVTSTMKNGFISGGIYSTDVSELCAGGYTTRKNADGTYGIKAAIEAMIIPSSGIPVNYEYFTEAVKAAKEGDTITVVNNVTVDEVLTIDKNITIADYGRLTVNFVGDGAFHVTKTNELTLEKVVIKNGKIYADSVEAGATVNGQKITGIATQKSALTSDGTNVTLTNPEWVAKIGTTYYMTLAEAVAAGGEVKLLRDFALDETVKVNGTVVLNLNGKTITGTDNATGNFALIEIQPGADLTIKGEGEITLTATTNRDFKNYSSVISNQRGKLTVEAGTIKHLGGTDMAYGIDNLTNGKGTYAETIINGGTIKSTYRGIRQFLNGVEAQNILTVNGGTIEGANKSIWMQDPSKNANTGTLTVDENAILKGDVYLYVTEGSTEWPVEVSIAAAALKDGAQVITGNVPAGYELVKENGTIGVKSGAAKIGTDYFETLEAALAAADADDKIILVTDIELADTLIIDKAGAITIDGNGKKITLAESFANTNTWGAAIMLGNSGYGDADTSAHTVTIKNVTFSDITGNSLIRAQGITLNITDCSVVGCDSTATDQGMLRIDSTAATISNTSFTGNAATKILGHNHNTSGSKSKLVVDNCSFENNTITGPGVIVLSSDAGCTINNSDFIGNNVTCTNGATVYMGFSENNIVTGNLFKNNVVTGNASNGRVAGALFVGYTNVINGNAFEGNTATNASGNAANNVCVDTIYAHDYGYDLDIDLSGNYWGGEAPVYGEDYTVNSAVADAYSINNYYTVCALDADGNVTLSEAAEIKHVASVNGVKYETLEDALKAVQSGDTVTLLRDVTIDKMVKIEKPVILDLNNKTVTATSQKAFEVYADATIKNGTIEAVNRCVDTRKAVELTLNNVNLIADNYTSDYSNPQPLTIGGSEDGTKLTMTNSTISAKDGYGIIAFVKTDATITGSTITGYNALYMKSGSDNSVINFVDSDLTGDLRNNDVEGNSFSVIAIQTDNVTVNVDKDSTVTAEGNHHYAVSLGSKSNPDVSGNKVTIAGTITGNVLATAKVEENTVTVGSNYADELYTHGYAYIANGDGSITAAKAVAQVGETVYADLQTAVNAVESEGTITVLSDITLTEGVTVPADKTITLDLNGHNITGTPAEAKAFAVITNKGNLTITGTGTITCDHKLPGSTGYAVNTITNIGTLVIDGVTIENKSNASNQIGYAIDNISTSVDAVLTIKNGKITASGSDYYDGIRQFANSQTNENSVTVEGGEVSSIWLQNPSDGSEKNTKDVKGNVSITNGKVSALYLEPSSEFKASITGGEIGKVLYNETAQGRDLTGFISGGTFENVPADNYLAEGFCLYYAGGKFTVMPDSVAFVNGKIYGTIQAAVEAAKVGDTVLLLKSFDEENPLKKSVIIDKNITLDLNGMSIAADTDSTFIRVQNGANVTVKNGNITSASHYVFTLGASDGSSEGNLTIESGTYVGQTTVASVAKGTLTITGGDFTENGGNYGTTYLLNCIDANYKDGSAKIIVSGGTFHGFDPANNAAEGTGTDFCAEGYITVADGDTYNVILDKVAEINGVGYDTVAAALAAAKSGETVTLLKDAEETGIVVQSGITFDLNGNTLDATYVIGFNGSNVVDNSSDNAGLLKVAEDAAILNTNNTQLPVWNGEGYVFVTVNFAMSLDNGYTGEGIKILTLVGPELNVVELLKNGAADNNIEIGIRLTWNAGTGTTSQDLIFNEETISQVFSSNNGTATGYGQRFYMIVTGVDDVDNLQARTIVKSDTKTEILRSKALVIN